VCAVTLSTANNSESDNDFTSTYSGQNRQTLTRQKALLLAVKTSYFLNIQTASGGAPTIQFDGASRHPSIIRATSAYLG
jgi:hypothetical protein